MVMPINPVDNMGDVIIDEGMQRPMKTDADKEKAFNQYLVEEIFMKDMFSAENSIYKPDPEEETLFSPKNNSLYGEFAKKEIARYIVDNNNLMERK